MTTITWPSDTPDVIDAIRNTIGRDITIYSTVSGIPCPNPNDSLDPVTGLSTNQFCPICSGNYWINTTSGLTLKAHVITKGVDTPNWQSGGIVLEGDAAVQIKYTVANFNAINTSKYIEVDGREYIKKDLSLRGVPDINRIVVTLVEKEGV